MDIYKPYQSLTAGQQKLLCFLAYIGKETDRSIINGYAKGEDFKLNIVNDTLRSLRPYYQQYYTYAFNYSLEYEHSLLALLFLIEKHPQWLTHFDSFYSALRSKNSTKNIHLLQSLLEGKAPKHGMIVTEGELEALIPLASDRRFHPLIVHVPSFYFNQFCDGALVWQLKYDMSDPDNMIGQLAEGYYPSMDKTAKEATRSAIALYDFFKTGRFDAEAADLNTICGHILKGVSLSYKGEYKEASNQIAAAIRINNKNRIASEKGFFHQLLNNYLAIMTYRLQPDEDGLKKLKALSNKRTFIDRDNQKAAAMLLDHFLTGSDPDGTRLARKAVIAAADLDFPHAWLCMLTARFANQKIVMPKAMPKQPSLAILRHELSSWLDLSGEEKDQLCQQFGGTPLISRVRHKPAWEILLEELTPKATGQEVKQKERDVRVSYLVNYGHVEVREQRRKLNGEWGAGKSMSFDTFRRGTDFMDETDRRIAGAIPHTFYYDVSDSDVIPFLVGSDRVYTGHRAPFLQVTVTEEKPYLIIEKTAKGFLLKSNLGREVPSHSTICIRKDDCHYVIIRLTDQQRNYYQRLLRLGLFPLEAEGQLREFLPKVSDVVEVHSDLVEGGSTLQQREGSAALCLQVLPSVGTRNTFTVYCQAKPLPASNDTFPPAKGLNPCVAEEEGVRYQVQRDIKGERKNLKMLTSFMDDNDFSETIDDETPADISAEELLRLLGFVRENAEHFFIEWPKGEQLRLKTSQPGSWNIQLKSRNGWFEVEGEVPIDDDTVLTAEQFLRIVAENPQSGFVRLNDTDYIAISDKLRRQLNRIESLTVSDHGHLRISEFHVSQLAAVLSGEIQVKHDKRIEELQEKIRKSMDKNPKVSKKLKAELRDYQTDGYQWMERITGWGAGICLADDMGLGKTVQTIAFMLDKMKEGPALVAAPASVVPNWRNELARFSPTLNVHILNQADDRHETIQKAKAGDVVITTYGLFVTEGESLIEKEWTTICLDEAHVIKNRETKTSSVVMKLQAEYRILLTGTPMQNHLGELWNLFQFINPGLLGSYEQFSKKYIVPIEQQDNKERSRQLRRIIAPFMLRRTKQEVVEELPDKMEITMPVELSTEEMAVYEVIRRRAKKMLEDETRGSISMNTLAEITRLRQAACAAQLAEKSWQGDCSKVKLVTELVDDIVGGGNSVLVFSQFTSFLAMVRQAFDAAKIPYLYLDGSVTMKRRETLVAQFQRGECPVFIISLKAGGLGLNLTGANYVVHLDPWWNPAIEQQATDRAYRIGQRQNVTVYHLISQHTIEEKILRLHTTKRNLADAMLEGSNQSHRLTAKDLLQMLGND